MRFLLVGVSVLVAVVTMVWSSRQTSVKEYEEEVHRKEKSSGVAVASKIFLDFLTGKYLWDRYIQGMKRVRSAKFE
jgi:hypothetical protein